jgi:hypothetical protein
LRDISNVFFSPKFLKVIDRKGMFKIQKLVTEEVEEDEAQEYTAIIQQ